MHYRVQLRGGQGGALYSKRSQPVN
jgi:hypothetical protein